MQNQTTQVRMDCEALINSVASSVWDMWSNTNNAINKRGIEMNDAKNRIQSHLQNVLLQYSYLKSNFIEIYIISF